MPKLTITAGPLDGGAGTAIYTVLADDGSSGHLATASRPRRQVGEVLEAPLTPPRLVDMKFNGQTVDYFLPEA